MRTEVIEVKKYMPFKRIFGNINLSAFRYLISNVFIDNEYISYDLNREDNEVSVTIIMENHCIETITITMENNDETLVREFKTVWSE
jgi:hypothetical protein